MAVSSCAHWTLLPINLLAIYLWTQFLFTNFNYIIKACPFSFSDCWNFHIFPIYNFSLWSIHPALSRVLITSDTKLRLLWNYILKWNVIFVISIGLIQVIVVGVVSRHLSTLSKWCALRLWSLANWILWFKFSKSFGLELDVFIESIAIICNVVSLTCVHVVHVIHNLTIGSACIHFSNVGLKSFFANGWKSWHIIGFITSYILTSRNSLRNLLDVGIEICILRIESYGTFVLYYVPITYLH